jgi:hypothetical protein
MDILNKETDFKWIVYVNIFKKIPKHLLLIGIYELTTLILIILNLFIKAFAKKLQTMSV